MASVLPVWIESHSYGESLTGAFPRLRAQIESLLPETGGVLLRGFSVQTIEMFREFAAAFGHPLLSYEFASTPRSAVTQGIYTSTEYPAHQYIPLHSEQSYTRDWPMKIWFHCVTAARAGGETPIADNRAIYERMPAAICDRFAAGILYVRNYGDFDVPWQKVFNAQTRADVETFCRRAQIECEWQPNGDLRTRQLCQSIETHPRTGQKVWFNQAHLFHVSSLEQDVRDMLVETVGMENLPRNAYFADGTAIPDSLLNEIRAVLSECTATFPWRSGDVLMLDNMLVAHGRAPFKGPRKVVVAMAEPHGNLGANACT